jgi:CheY-like chemotaxis protein
MQQADRLRVLVVDDNPAVLRAYGSVLTRHGVSGDIASNGREAVERVNGS